MIENTVIAEIAQVPPAAKNRFLSLHYMRGFAALLVLYAHNFIVAMTDPDFPKRYLPMISPFPVVGVTPMLRDFYLRPEYFIERYKIISGEFGVMLFFLISGFLIPSSVEKTGVKKFLIRRFFRIYPLNIVAMCLTALGGSLYVTHFGVQSPFTILNTLASSLLVSGWFNQFYTTPLIWTLIVEVHFYLLVAGWIALRKKLEFGDIVFIGGVLAIISHLSLHAPRLHPYVFFAVMHAGLNSNFIIYMLIGTVIAKARQSYWKSGLSIAALGTMFVISQNFWEPLFFNRPPIDEISAAVAVLFFCVMLLAERAIPRVWLLSFLADISYPLYLVHVPFSWAVLYEMTRRGINPHMALGMACASSVVFAWLLHVVIERPSHRLGVRLTK